jgi:hypothetical protein
MRSQDHPVVGKDTVNGGKGGFDPLVAVSQA